MPTWWNPRQTHLVEGQATGNGHGGSNPPSAQVLVRVRSARTHIFLCLSLDMSQRSGFDPIVVRVAARYAFRHQPRETKEHKVDRLKKIIRDATGLSGGMSEQIADAIVRGREIDRLAIQKGWPIEDGVIEGDNGALEVSKIREMVRTTA